MFRKLRFPLIISFWYIANFVTAYFAHQYDRYNEHFPFKFQLYHNNPFIPKFLISFANYDGAHYLHIAHDGYHIFEQAFFPLFPLLIRILSPLLDNGYFLTGFFIANICFLAGLYFFKKYVETLGMKSSEVFWIMLFLLVFPTSFFFTAVYTEGLFFLLVSASLYYTQKQKYWLVALFCFLAALTRLMGFFLWIPVLFALFEQHIQWKGKSIAANIRSFGNYFARHLSMILLLFSPVFGLGAYGIYLFQTTKNPLYFYSALSGFHTGRSTKHFILLPQIYYRYLHIFLSAQHTFIYFIAVVEFILFNVFLFTLLYDLWRLWKDKKEAASLHLIGLSIFSLLVLLVPTFTGTLTSLPRYILLSLSFFIRIGAVQNIYCKILLAILFFIFHLLLLWFFIQGYFIS